MRSTFKLLWVAVAVIGVSACGGGSPKPTDSPTAIGGIGVSENSKPIGTYATMDEAIAKASQLAGFQVLPVLNLPAGFSVSFFDALTLQPDPNAPYKPPQDAFYPRHVQVGVRSDSGGLLIDESSVRITAEGDAVKIGTSSLGEFYEFGPSDAPLKFELVTADRIFTILAPKANLTRSQALAILSAFHSGVNVVEGGANGVPLTTKPFPSVTDALVYVSSRAGFPVTVPGYLPPGYALTEIDIPPRPPASIDSSGLPFLAVLKIQNESAGFRIQEANVKFTVDQNPSQLIASPSAGSQVFKDGGAAADKSVNYTLVTPTRIVLLGTGVPNPLTDDEAVQVLSSLP